ncbi:hypothetical protein [Streptomyces sp. SP18BB07]|uniref:hypothetical protein n=1 Tax=Streptomyces sp. SP18BB07 TaxID=3002522 RepID=UPI002E78D839|nr:hypothetical protein [Streptomyces sp. SP18BB07]MEE1764353.1 hypothetical protein [Streptomyces sp. SP18BB07]
MPKAGITYSKKHIEKSNFAEIRKQVESDVKEELGAITRPDDRVERAANIIRQADAEIALHAEDRDKAVASLWFYEQVLGLAAATGVAQNAYREILSKVLYGDPKQASPAAASNEELVQIAKDAGLKRVDDADEKLPELARIVFTARARRAAAVVFMRKAALALSQEPYGWSVEKIAEHAGVGTKLIYQQQRTARLNNER